jgi:hypothetical protein
MILLNSIMIAIMVIVLPFLFGYFTFKLFRKRKSLAIPAPFSFWLFWLTGLLLLNIPVIINAVIKTDLITVTSICLAILLIANLIFTRNQFSYTKSNLSKITSSQKFSLPNILGFGFVFVFFIIWYNQKGWLSLTPDIFQNYQIGNIMYSNKVWALLPDTLSPMFNAISYTTFLHPLYAIIQPFYSIKDILYVFTAIEFVLLGFAYWSRSAITESLVNNKYGATLITVLSFVIVNAGLMPANLLLNQQIVVLLFPSILWLYYSKMWKYLFGFLFILVTFHTVTASLVVLFLLMDYVVKYFYTTHKYNLVKYISILIFLIGALCIYLSSLESFKLWIIENFYNKITDNREILSTLTGFNQPVVFERLLDASGFLLVGTTLVSWFLAFKLKNQKAMSFTIFSFVLVVLSLSVVPLSVRFLGLLTLPLMLSIYIISSEFIETKSHKWLNSFFILLLLSVLFMVPLREAKAGTATYFSQPFYRTEEIEALLDYKQNTNYKDLLKKSNVEDVKIVSEYFTKHLAEITYSKFNDNGVYETSETLKGTVRNLMIGIQTKPCEVFSEKYLLVIYSNRANRWVKVPYYIANSRTFNFWYIESPDQRDVYSIKNYSVNFEKTTELESYYSKNFKFILLECNR